MGLTYGFVSTYPPTQCGLATFTASLNHALTRPGVDRDVIVRLLDAPVPEPATEPGAELVAGDRAGIGAAAARLDRCDLVILQHEFGVYGGPDGAEVLDLLDALRAPTVVVLHTVLVEPTAHQRAVLEAVVAAADAVVTMTAAARDRLRNGYDVDMTKVEIIAHGAPDMRAAGVPGSRGADRTVLTWGLLGPGKGIEWGIAAMALLRDLRPAPHYVIAGETHPKVVDNEGETYRNALTRQIRELGLTATVRLDPKYRDAVELRELVAGADVVLLPYDSTDQVTSGVLIEAVAAGKPVVATGFPHAVELLSGGSGLVVPHRDPAAIAAALRTVLTRSEVAASMTARADETTPNLLWSAVAERYRELAHRLIRDRVPA